MGIHPKNGPVSLVVKRPSKIKIGYEFINSFNRLYESQIRAAEG